MMSPQAVDHSFQLLVPWSATSKLARAQKGSLEDLERAILGPILTVKNRRKVSFVIFLGDLCHQILPRACMFEFDNLMTEIS